MSPWKKQLFSAYKHLLQIVALLDFNFPIEVADRQLQEFVADQKANLLCHTNPKSLVYIEKQDKWMEGLEETVRFCEGIIKETSPIKRREMYAKVIASIKDCVDDIENNIF